MKRKLLSLCSVVAVLMVCFLPVAATETEPVRDVKICSSYWQDGMLHTFAHLSIDEPEEQRALLFVNNWQYQQASPVSMKNTETPVHYMLLIDTSTSMPEYGNEVLALVKELMDAEVNIEISVAKFNRVFSVVDERLKNWNEVKASIKSLKYTGDGSDISGSVAEAIAYLGANGYPMGEMTNLLVITDGKPWYSNNEELEKECEEQSNLAATKMIAAYPEIVVHSYSFEPWNDALYAALSTGTGLHTAETSVEEVGKALADYSDALYMIPFEIQGYDDIAQIQDSFMLNIGNYFASYSHVRNVEIVPEVNLEHTQEDNPEEESLPDETTAPCETTAPDETAPTGTNGNGADTTDSPEETTTESAETEVTAGLTEDPNKPDGTRKVWGIVCAVAVALAIVGVVVIVVARKSRVRANSVRMRIEVVAGNKIRVKKEYYLVRELLIGSEKNCDVVLLDSGANNASARIFRQGQIIYVEDMGSVDGTLLNGMRLFSSNRLRSGDEITVGMTTLRVLF